MQGRHHPIVSRADGGQWIVHCPQCRSLMAVPYGIDVPVRSRDLAERISRGHEVLGGFVRWSASRPLIVQSDPAELAA